MAGYGRDASMQAPTVTITASPIIDIPAALLQSEAAGGANGMGLALICALAAAAGWVIWRWKLVGAPRDAAGRLPQDALIGVIAMLAFYVSGTVGAAGAQLLAPADEDYARLIQGAGANVVQLALALAVIHSGLFIDAPTKPSRWTRAIAEGCAGFLLAVPVTLALGALIGIGMTALGFDRPPETSHETLRILSEKRDALFTALTLAHVAILVPLAEEAGWRGLLQPSIRRAGLGAVAASIATALLFAGIHWTMIPPEGRAAGLPMLATLGFALGMLRERTGGVLAPTMLHAAFNALNVWMTLARDA